MKEGFKPSSLLKGRRRGFSLAEAMVMIVIAGSCMVPILNTMQSGLTRTQNLGHQARMKVLCESRFNEAVSNLYLLDSSAAVGTGPAIPWPDTGNPADQIATYLVNISMTGGIQVASMTGGGAPATTDGLLMATQPQNLRAMVVTVYLQNDDATQATQSICISTLVALPKLSGLNMVFISDPIGHLIYTFNPWSRKASPGSLDMGTIIPGNMAVHPSNKWLAVQAKHDIWLYNVDGFSAGFGSFSNVFASATHNSQFLSAETDSGVRTSNGIVFRPDGRYCYLSTPVNAYNSSLPSLLILQVPTVLPGPFTQVNFLPTTGNFANNIFKSLVAGEDGYLYLARGDNNVIYRLPMWKDPASLTDHDLEKYNPGSYTWACAPTAVAIARDGRNVFSLWPNATFDYCWSPSLNPASATKGYINHIAGAGGQTAGPTELKGVSITMDNRWAIISAIHDCGAFPKMFPSPFIKLPPDPTRTNNGGTDMILPNNYIQTSNTLVDGNAGWFAVTSPNYQDVIFDWDSLGYLVVPNIASATNGLLQTGVDSTRFINLSSRKDACITSRQREEILVGTSNSVAAHSIETVDLYGLDENDLPRLYTEWSKALTSKPAALSLNGAGSLLAVASGANFAIFDVAKKSLIASDVTMSFSTGNASTGVFLLDGGFLGVNSFGNEYKVFRPRAYASLDPTPDDSSAALTQILPGGLRVIFVKPMNDGGAMVLSSTWGFTAIAAVTDYTVLDRIGPDYKLWARWDSRYDTFPPRGVRKFAVSPDDSLLALYDPISVGTADNDRVAFYDLRSQNFKDLTQQYGLIGDYRVSTIGDLMSAVRANQVFTGAGIKLRETFTCNDQFAGARDYPANSQTGGTPAPPLDKYWGGSNRFFGYYYQPGTAYISGITDDEIRMFDDGLIFGFDPPAASNWVGAKNLWMAYNWNPNLPPGGRRFQLDFCENVNGGSTCSMFTLNTPIAATGDTVAGNQDTALTGGNGPSAVRVASTSFRPMRLIPQYLNTYTTPDTITGNKGSMVFSRDVASPTLFFLNEEDSKLSLAQWGTAPVTFDLTASIAAGLATGEMAISPDGQRLIVTTTATNKIRFIDVSVPPTSTFGKVISEQDLPQVAQGLAVRSFNRTNSNRDTYAFVATLATAISGDHVAALASGGIFLLGGSAQETSAPTRRSVQFNPITNLFPAISNTTLLASTSRHSVVSYDNELLAFLGTGTEDCLYDVQKWNPVTGEILRSPPPMAAVTPVLHTTLSGMTNHWRFDENGGGSAFDSIGGQTGTLSGPPTWTTGKYGSGLSFNGTTHYVNCGSNASLNLAANPFTAAIWFKTSNVVSYGTSYRSMIEWGNWQSGAPIYPKMNVQDGTGILDTWWGGSSRCAGLTGGLDDGNWHHCAMTRNGNNFQYYLDGVANGGVYTQAVTFDLQTLVFGRGPNAAPTTAADGSWDGELDDAQFFNRALSAAEVLTVKNGGYSDAHWRFDEGGGTTAADSTGNDHGGKLIGAAGWGAGQVNGCLGLTGAGDHVQVPPANCWNFSGNFTLFAWVKYSAFHASWWDDTIIGHDTGGGATNKWMFGYDNAGSRSFFHINNTVNVDQDITGGAWAAVPGTWYCLALTRTGTTYQFYRNGALDGAAVVNATVIPTTVATVPLTIGYCEGANSITGGIDEVHIFNRALTQTEIQTLMTMGSAQIRKSRNDFNSDTSVLDVVTSNIDLLGGRWGWRAFIPGDDAWANGNAPPHWIKYKFGTTPEVVNELHLEWSGFGHDANSIVIEGANADSWPGVALGTVTPTNQGSSGYTQTLTFANSNAYSYYRFTIPTTSPDGSDFSLEEMELWGPTGVVFTPPASDTMSWISTDDFTTKQQRKDFSACLTPYGIVVAGGIDDADVLNAGAYVYWPHAIATQSGEVGQVSKSNFALSGASYLVATSTTSANEKVTATFFHNAAECAAMAFDGNPASFWCPQANYPCSMTYDFGPGNQRYVSTFTILCAAGQGPNAFTLNGSDDGITYTQVFSGAKANVATVCTFTVTLPGSYRYYNFQYITGFGNGHTHEIELYGSTGSGVGGMTTQWGISRELPVLPLADLCYGHSLVYHSDGFLYRIGGTTNGALPQGNFRRFNFTTNVWDPLGGVSTDLQRWKAAVCSFGDEIFIFGGRNNGGTIQTAVAWTPPPANRIRYLSNVPKLTTYGMTAVPVGPYIYLIGGATSAGAGGSTNILRYTP